MSEFAFVRVDPLGVLVEVRTNESLLDAAWRHGLDWPTLCYGQAECGVCRVEVVSGESNIVPAADAEHHALRALVAPTQLGHGARLACRMMVKPTSDCDRSEIIVWKRGVRAAE